MAAVQGFSEYLPIKIHSLALLCRKTESVGLTEVLAMVSEG